MMIFNFRAHDFSRQFLTCTIALLKFLQNVVTLCGLQIYTYHYMYCRQSVSTCSYISTSKLTIYYVSYCFLVINSGK